MTGEVKDIPEELMQLIQSQSAVKEAARTGVLSKSWLHAWSTNPTLKFWVFKKQDINSWFHVLQKQKDYGATLMDVESTLGRYLPDNIPIKTFELVIDIENWESADRTRKLIRDIATKTYLKEFSLSISPYGEAHTFGLPDELLLSENLTKISFRASGEWGTAVWMTSSKHPVIKCISLRELHLHCVAITEEALNQILASCTLLVKIELTYIECHLKTINVKNLPCLYELCLAFDTWYSPALEISDIPNLHVFRYDINNDALEPSEYGDLTNLPDPLQFNAIAHSMSLSNVTELRLSGVVPDYECLDIITSGFPFLESLTLSLTTWKLRSFHFKCASIKIFSLVSCKHKKLLDIQIYAPKLLSFSFSGYNMPDLLFPVSSLGKINLSLRVFLPVDASFFIKMREALNLSRKCDIRIKTSKDRDIPMPLGIDIKYLRRRLKFPPATNVQQLDFGVSYDDDCLWDRSPFFDAFFEICHPKRVLARQDYCINIMLGKVFKKNHFCRLMFREVLEKKTTTALWPRHLKHVQVRRFLNEKWETLTNLQRSFLQESDPVYFKLEWG